MEPRLEIEIESGSMPSAELKQALEEAAGKGAGVRLELRPNPSPFRVDPTIVVALLTGGATVVGSLITGIATWLAARKGSGGDPGSLRVQTVEGTVVEFPADAPPDRVEEVLAAVRRSPPRRILIVD